MAEPLWLRVVYFSVVALYPLLIYFGLQTVDPRWLTLILVLAAARHIMGRLFSPAIRIVWGLCILVLVLSTLVTGSDAGLLFYPVLVSGLMFLLFFSSWLRPPTIIEMLARVQQPELPPEAIMYTRRLTLVWCAFFIINGAISLATVGMSRESWTLYNGLVSYVLMAMLFGGELLVRRRILGG